MTLDTTSAYGAFITRIAFGGMLIAHSLLKVLVFSIPGTVGFFESQGFPGFTAYLVIFGELFGGIAIMLGLFTRLAALLSIPILLGALFVHSGNGWVFSNAGGGWEYPLFLVLIALSVALQGNGAYSIRQLPFSEAYKPQSSNG